MKSALTKWEILTIWEKRWGQLSPKWQEKFLNNPYLEEIAQFEGQLVSSIINNNQKLEYILSVLRWNAQSKGDNQEGVAFCQSCGRQITNIESNCNC